MALAVFVLAALMDPAGGRSVTAREAGPTPAPALVDPVPCQVEPRPVGEIVALAGTAVAVLPTAPGTAAGSIATPPPARFPAGEPADPETAAGVTATVFEVFACLEAGEFARAYALCSDEFVRREVGPLTEEDLAFLEGVGFPNAAERTPPALAVHEIRVLPDGRAAALVVVEAPEAPGPRRVGYILAWGGERWLIDETITDVLVEATPEV